MFLSAITGMPNSARYQIYNGIDGTVRSISFIPDPTCIVCSGRGALGRGNEWNLPEELLSILNGLPNRKHQNGIVHGDLHDLNIRIRQNDAILIDFAKVREGPIAVDCAALEVSLVFDHDSVVGDKGKWIKFVNHVYSLNFCKVCPDFETLKSLHWLGAAVYEIRKIACALRASEYEFSIILALYLLNRSTYAGESEADEECKTYAYVIAERLILEIATEMGCKC